MTDILWCVIVNIAVICYTVYRCVAVKYGVLGEIEQIHMDAMYTNTHCEDCNCDALHIEDTKDAR